MHCISKHFTTDGYNQIVLERADWTEEQFGVFMDIFGLTDAEKIVITDYKIEAYSKPVPTDVEWAKAFDHLMCLIDDYESCGHVWDLTLRTVHYPLRDRYSSGERTRELYNEISNVY